MCMISAAGHCGWIWPPSLRPTFPNTMEHLLRWEIERCVIYLSDMLVSACRCSADWLAPANNLSHTHVCGHEPTTFCRPMVWFGWQADHAITCGKRECCSHWQTLAYCVSLTLGWKFFNFQSALHAQACSLLLPLESEPPSVAPVVWAKHPLFLYSSFSVTFPFQCLYFSFFPRSLRSSLQFELLSITNLTFFLAS